MTDPKPNPRLDTPRLDLKNISVPPNAEFITQSKRQRRESFNPDQDAEYAAALFEAKRQRRESRADLNEALFNSSFNASATEQPQARLPSAITSPTLPNSFYDTSTLQTDGLGMFLTLPIFSDNEMNTFESSSNFSAYMNQRMDADAKCNAYQGQCIDSNPLDALMEISLDQNYTSENSVDQNPFSEMIYDSPRSNDFQGETSMNLFNVEIPQFKGRESDAHDDSVSTLVNDLEADIVDLSGSIPTFPSSYFFKVTDDLVPN